MRSAADGRGRRPDGLVEPMPEEARNGWTPESLTAYLRERDKAATATVLERPTPRPIRQNHRYAPHRWRG